MRSWTLVASGLALGLVLGACGDDDGPGDATDAVEVDTSDTTGPDTNDTTGPDTDDTSDTAESDTDDTSDTAKPDTHDAIDPDTRDTVDPDAADTSDDTSEPDTNDDTGEVADTDTSPTLPLPGFGQISGACGVIDDELYDSGPSFFVNALDFDDNPYDIEDFDALTAHGQELILDGNAGGNSLLSEVFAMEVLARCELATLIASETEILYDVEGKITDILVEIDGEKVGVSVVRAVGFPKDAPYTVEQATTIIRRKLEDILASSQNVSEEHRWVKQILSVLAYADGHVASVQSAWEALPEATRADTIILVTVTHGDDAFMY